MKLSKLQKQEQLKIPIPTPCLGGMEDFVTKIWMLRCTCILILSIARTIILTKYDSKFVIFDKIAVFLTSIHGSISFILLIRNAHYNIIFNIV